MITLRKEEEEAASADDGFADSCFQAELQWRESIQIQMPVLQLLQCT